jgi:hypothetical protein
MEQKPSGPLGLVSELGDPLKKNEGTVFDRQGPDGPPQPVLWPDPPHIEKIRRFLGSVVKDEGLLVRLCLDHATDIVIYNFKKRAAGSDLMAEISALHFVGAAVPLAVELYKQSLEAVKDRADEYKALVEEAQKEMASAAKPTSPILVP